MAQAERARTASESADSVLSLIDAELDRLAIDEGTRPYPWNTRWWMWREKRFNEGVNIAHKVSAEKLQEIRNAYVQRAGRGA